MTISHDDWSGQLRRQARWARELRERIFGTVDLAGASRVLDVGCGTGVISAELSDVCLGAVTGVDCDGEMLAHARETCPGGEFVEGDAHALPFADGFFDVAVTNCVLMWVRDPGAVVREMARVVRPGGFVAALGEPDYEGRIDYPPEVATREILMRAMAARGGDPAVGRKLKALMVDAGLKVEAGVHAAVPSDMAMMLEFEDAWAFAGKIFEPVISPGELEALKARDYEAIRKGVRLVLSPLFWAVGKKPPA